MTALEFQGELMEDRKDWIIPQKTKRGKNEMRKRPETKIVGKKTKGKLHPENSVLTRRYPGACVQHAKYYLLDFRGHERAFRVGFLAGWVFDGLGVWRVEVLAGWRVGSMTSWTSETLTQPGLGCYQAVIKQPKPGCVH